MQGDLSTWPPPTGKAFQRSAISNLGPVQLQKSHAESCAIDAAKHPSVGQAIYLGICAQFTQFFVATSVIKQISIQV